ncbi:MAG: hypothetical protein U0L72_06515 [Acutalibacteraceae bacterium]|nr:hypothetical protein [Acutalibacteraceae bacterium]
MKSVKSVILFLILLCLCSCSSEKDYTYPSPDYPIIEAPDRTDKETADGYRDIPADTNSEVTLYYANKESKKIHLPSCYYAKKMAETKIRIEQDKEVLIYEGYTNCSFCNP